MSEPAGVVETHVGQLPSVRWSEYKALRLEALSEAPQAFGSSYAATVAQPDDYWIGRLRDVELGRSVLLVAERESQLVGMIGAFWGDEDSEPDVATIIAVYVQPAYRGQGISSQLLVSVLESLRSVPGIDRAQLTVNPIQQAAVRLYRRHGFEVVQTTRSQMGDGVEYDELVMERRIQLDR